MVSFNVQPILPLGRDRERERYHNLFVFRREAQAKQLFVSCFNCTIIIISVRNLLFVMHLFVIYWKIVQLLRHLSCLNYRSGLCGPLSTRVSWSSLQPPGCEATAWEIEGALAEWTGTEWIQFLHLVITFVAFRGSLQMYFRSQYGRYFCIHIEFVLSIFDHYLIYIYIYILYIYILEWYIIHFHVNVQCIYVCMCICHIAVDDTVACCTALRHISRHFWLRTHSQCCRCWSCRFKHT